MSRFETVPEPPSIGGVGGMVDAPAWLKNHRGGMTMEFDIGERAAFYLGKGFH